MHNHEGHEENEYVHSCACEHRAHDEHHKDEKHEEGIMLFGTKTCPNCKAAGKLLDKAKIKYEFIDAEEKQDLTKKYSVKQAPTLVVVKDGSAQNIVNLSNIKKFIEEASK